MLGLDEIPRLESYAFLDFRSISWEEKDGGRRLYKLATMVFTFSAILTIFEGLPYTYLIIDAFRPEIVFVQALKLKKFTNMFTKQRRNLVCWHFKSRRRRRHSLVTVAAAAAKKARRYQIARQQQHCWKQEYLPLVPYKMCSFLIIF